MLRVCPEGSLQDLVRRSEVCDSAIPSVAETEAAFWGRQCCIAGDALDIHSRTQHRRLPSSSTEFYDPGSGRLRCRGQVVMRPT
jgi:hypothetical protein